MNHTSRCHSSSAVRRCIDETAWRTSEKPCCAAFMCGLWPRTAHAMCLQMKWYRFHRVAKKRRSTTRRPITVAMRARSSRAALDCAHTAQNCTNVLHLRIATTRFWPLILRCCFTNLPHLRQYLAARLPPSSACAFSPLIRKSHVSNMFAVQTSHLWR